MKIHTWLLTLLIVCSVALRLTNLGGLPSSFTPDELAQGYTAYSLLTTGRDEWGKRWPLNLRSYGDFKPPLQTYLMIPFIHVFGLNPTAVRLPNAILSVCTVLAVYLFVSTLFASPNIALLTSTFIAFSPWHLPMSRLALEANLSSFFISLGSYFLLVTKAKNRFWYVGGILASVLFGLNMFSSHAAKLFTPGYVVCLLVFIIQPGKRTIVNYWSFGLLFTGFLIFAFASFFFGAASRGSDLAIANPTDGWLAVSTARFQMVSAGVPDLIARLFHNKVTHVVSSFSSNYLSYLSPQFLLTNGAGETTYGMLPGYGVLNPLSFLGLVMAIWYVFSRYLKANRTTYWFILLSVLWAIVPASLAKGSFAANRAATMIPFVQLLGALGIYHVYSLFRSKGAKRLFVVFSIGIYCISTASFLTRYYAAGNYLLAEGMLYGRKQAIQEASLHKPKHWFVSPRLSEPQTFFMFFTALDPSFVQHHTPAWLSYTKNNLLFVDQLTDYNLGQDIVFRYFHFPEDLEVKNAVFIGRPEDFVGQKPSTIITYPDPATKREALYMLYTSETL